MKIEFDPTLDLLYVWFTPDEPKSARTDTLSPGIHADYDREGQLVGIEVLEASKLLGKEFRVEVTLNAPPPSV